MESKLGKAIVIIGIGELAGVFARGFLRYGHPVYPVTRQMRVSEIFQVVPEPELVLVAVAEKDFGRALKTIPHQLRDRIGLLQNELLPGDWKAHQIKNPTVISVWFEKKKYQDYKILIPSPVYGPKADLIADSLQCIDIPCKRLSSEDELLVELVVKNVFVFTINIAGLITGGTTGALWSAHKELALGVALEVIDLQEWLTGVKLERDRILDGLVAGINGDPDHKCTGRSAPDRLERCVELADKAGLEVPRIREINRSRLSTRSE
jgi:hypothetical protein